MIYAIEVVTVLLEKIKTEHKLTAGTSHCFSGYMI